ncbi:Protein of unknown function [Desulfatibacillum alkenivorans DSM 16219]|jgi:hypothetical protein|uniref:DUF3617 domain-containing protein n=1 Tax=Desulfatibacillum alkenivorans DSM 16219 TaxID=1121393 RepID=A0A1M6CY05_9BACT|nr:DUF3617 family protein [Desulfatibacillum alkenivorans]SHI65684.1 Protein of unknown function [Desulfatibacillum alkenivorans DSM 16219]
MKRIFAILFTLVFLAGIAQAGWFDDKLKGALQKAGERGIEEAVDGAYEGGKNAGKEAMEEAQEEEDEAEELPAAYQQQAAQSYQPQGRTAAIEPSPAQGVIEEIDRNSINMKEGNWKTTMIMQANGFTMPPQNYTTCLTRENIVPQEKPDDGECKITGLKAKGDTVYWTMECIDQESATYSRGEITYHGKTFEGTVVITVKPKEGGMMTMNNSMKGQYLGPCPE